MWYNNDLSSKIDGIEPFLRFFSTEEKFYNHFFENTIFFKQSTVKERSANLLRKIEGKEKIPVRFTMKSKDYFRIPTEDNQRGFNKKTFKNRKEAHDFAVTKNLVYKDTGINIQIDKDGNYYVRNEIRQATSKKVNSGSNSDIVNYEISHVWGNTENPLFFSSLWNIVLIPNYLSYILDKPDKENKTIKRVKTLIKAACFDLYNPNELMNEVIINLDNELKDGLDDYKKLKEKGIITIHFID